MLQRAYSLVTVKDFDPVTRKFSGIATSPEPDRLGDVIESAGVTYRNPLSLLLYHDTQKPVGEVSFKRPIKDGTPFNALISTLDRETGTVKERLDEAVDSLAARPPLIRGVSIGFRPLAPPTFNKETGGFRYPKIEVLELSMVVIPAHQDATIAVVKSLDADHLAASGMGEGVSLPLAGVTASPYPAARKGARAMTKTLTEQISAFEATRQAKNARMTELMTVAGDKGETLDAEQSEEYDGLHAEVKSIDEHLTRLAALEDANKKAAKPVNGESAQKGSESRGGGVITAKETLEPGIGFARAVKCQIVSQKDFRPVQVVAKEMYPHDQRLHQHLQFKTAVSAGTTTDATWAGPLVDPTNLAGEFIEFLRPQTIIGKFGTNGVPSLNRIPFNVRITGQTSGGDGYWVGQGAPKPLTKFDFNAVTHTFAKVAAIAVISEELARFSSPSAETLVRNALAAALIERVDRDFVDPDKGAVANVSPASITNNIAPITTAGSSASDVNVDVMAVFAPFIAANLTPTNGVWIMSHTTALALSLMRNALGQKEFPELTMMGGKFQGLPVITSEYVVTGSPASQLVILVNASDIFLSDDGQVTIDSSREASLQMDDAPTNNSATPTATSVVSMYQTDSIALRAHRFINWSRRRAQAVAYLESVIWGAGGGSPAP